MSVCVSVCLCVRQREKEGMASILLKLIVTVFHNNKPVSKAFYNQHLSQSLDTTTVLLPFCPQQSLTGLSDFWFGVSWYVCTCLCVCLSTCETPHCYTMCVEFHAIIAWGPEHMANKATHTTTCFLFTHSL